MKRALSLYLPTWSIDLLRRRLRRDGRLPDAASRGASRRGRGVVFLLTAPDHGREVVTRCCERACAAGVFAGMTLAHARALLHREQVHAEAESADRDAAALRALARWANRFAPTVATDPPDGLVLDVTGCERLYGGEIPLADAVGGAVTRLGVRCRLAIAPTIGGAWAWARYGDAARPILRDDDVAGSLAPLPVESLRIEPHAVEELAAVGVRRVEQLLDLPRAQLANRFGHAILRRIDQALRPAADDCLARAEAIQPVRPAPPPEVERVFDGPCRQYEAIELAVRGLVDALSAALRLREVGVRRLRLRLERSDAEPVQETLELSHPSRDAKHLWSLIRPRVERINLGYGVDAIRLTAADAAPLPSGQAALIADAAPVSSAADEAEAGRLIDVLSNRLGRDRVLRIEPVDTHVPEKSFRLRPASEPQARVMTEDPPALEGDRPSILLPQVRPVNVTLMRPEGPVLQVQHGEAQRVVATIGPERIAPRWWRSSLGVSAEGGLGGPPVRDYYKLQVEDGRWLWVFRELSSGRWYLHGMWA